MSKQDELFREEMHMWLECELGGRLIGKACYNLADDFLAKVKQHYEQKRLEVENQTIRVVLASIEKYGLDKVLALRDKRQSAHSILADLSDPFEVRGKGRGV